MQLFVHLTKSSGLYFMGRSEIVGYIVVVYRALSVLCPFHLKLLGGVGFFMCLGQVVQCSLLGHVNMLVSGGTSQNRDSICEFICLYFEVSVEII